VTSVTTRPLGFW